MTANERNARVRLLAAIEHAAYVRGEAQWANGYRAAGKDSTAMWDKERHRWRQTGDAERAMKRALAAYGRAVREATR